MTSARAAARLAASGALAGARPPATHTARLRPQTRCRAGFVVALCANGPGSPLTASAR